MSRPTISPAGSYLGVLLILAAVSSVYSAEASEDSKPATVERLRRALNGPVNVAFNNTPLSEVAAQLERACHIPIRVDEVPLQNSGISKDSTVTLNVNGARLRSVLNLVLGPLKLSWAVRDEVIWFTTQEEERSALVTRVYSVHDLVTPGASNSMLVDCVRRDYDSLIESITSNVHPDSWPDGTGPGPIGILESAEALIISQTWREHFEVEDLLAAIREAQAVKRQARDREIVPCAQKGNPLFTRVYAVEPPVPSASPATEANAKDAQRVKQKSSAEAAAKWGKSLADTVQATIDPKSWQGAGGEGTIKVIGHAIVVRQSGAIHAQVAELIEAVQIVNSPR